MKHGQKYSPKYWVVHDKRTDDVFMLTAHKNKFESVKRFIDFYSYEYFGTVLDEDCEEAFEDCEYLECILVELNMVEL